MESELTIANEIKTLLDEAREKDSTIREYTIFDIKNLMKRDPLLVGLYDNDENEKILERILKRPVIEKTKSAIYVGNDTLPVAKAKSISRQHSNALQRQRAQLRQAPPGAPRASSRTSRIEQKTPDQLIRDQIIILISDDNPADDTKNRMRSYLNNFINDNDLKRKCPDLARNLVGTTLLRAFRCIYEINKLNTEELQNLKKLFIDEEVFEQVNQIDWYDIANFMCYNKGPNKCTSNMSNDIHENRENPENLKKMAIVLNDNINATCSATDSKYRELLILLNEEIGPFIEIGEVLNIERGTDNPPKPSYNRNLYYTISILLVSLLANINNLYIKGGDLDLYNKYILAIIYNPVTNIDDLKFVVRLFIRYTFINFMPFDENFTEEECFKIYVFIDNVIQNIIEKLENPDQISPAYKTVLRNKQDGEEFNKTLVSISQDLNEHGEKDILLNLRHDLNKLDSKIDSLVDNYNRLFQDKIGIRTETIKGQRNGDISGSAVATVVRTINPVNTEYFRSSVKKYIYDNLKPRGDEEKRRLIQKINVELNERHDLLQFINKQLKKIAFEE